MTTNSDLTSDELMADLADIDPHRREAAAAVDAAWLRLATQRPASRAEGLPAGADVISVREQTEHLTAIEQALSGRGIPEQLIRLGFLILHRMQPMPYGIWADHCAVAYAAVLKTDRHEDAR